MLFLVKTSTCWLKLGIYFINSIPALASIKWLVYILNRRIAGIHSLVMAIPLTLGRGVTVCPSYCHNRSRHCDLNRAFHFGVIACRHLLQPFNGRPPSTFSRAIFRREMRFRFLRVELRLIEVRSVLRDTAPPNPGGSARTDPETNLTHSAV